MNILHHISLLGATALALGSPASTFAAKASAPAVTSAVFMANGVKIGEVTQTTAVIWTRLTRNVERNVRGFPFAELSGTPSEAAQLNGHALEEMEGAVPGAAGEVRLVYWPDGLAPEAGATTAWQAVSIKGDFAAKIAIAGLKAGTRYRVRAEGRSSGGGQAGCVTLATFATAAARETPSRVSFTVVTGQDYVRRDDPENGHKVYLLMRQLKPDFFVHTGDIEYYDKPTPLATNERLARFKWNRIYSMPFQRAFHNEVASYFIKDDHDTLKNDAWPGQTYGDLTWAQGLAIAREQLPYGDKTYRHMRWGRDLEVWLVEGRDFRSANNMPDGPDKTIWGREQKQWFFDTVRKSDATFRILISPTPLVGPDRTNKGDNHANREFTHEGRELREFIATQKNMVVVCGDRHWQYVSVDPATGVREYSCGPTSDVHAAGFSESDRTSAHRYLKIKGGFLAATVERVEGRPRAVFRHYGVDGQLYNEDVLPVK